MTKDPVKIAATRARANEARKARLRNDPAYAEKVRSRDRARNRQVPKGMMLEKVSKLVDLTTGEAASEWQKSKLRPEEPPRYPLDPPGFTMTRQASMITSAGVGVQWVTHEKDKAQQYEEMLVAMRAATAEYKGLVAPTPAPDHVDASLMNVLLIGDPHFGMLAWGKETDVDFDSNICRDDLLRAVRTAFARAPRAKRCLIAEMGDLFHSEDDKNRTPAGQNPLDADSRAGRINRIVYTAMRALVDAALETHEEVTVAIMRGNHDPYKSIGMALYLEGVYENEPRVKVLDNNNPYIFIEHGKNLIGLHHGDGSKPEGLPGIMASWEDGKPWGRASFRKWYTGHIHTRKAIDFPGVSWESCRTLAPGDYWAWHKGYRSEQSLELHTFDVDFGLVARQTTSLLMARIHGRDR